MKRALLNNGGLREAAGVDIDKRDFRGNRILENLS